MTGPRINPEAHGVSGTWAALDRHQPAADDPMTFAFGDHIVRALLIDEDPWFVLADVCRALSLTSPARVAERIESDGVSSAQVIDSMGRTQTATIINESGLYEVVIRSDKPEARRFRRWITAEVLPSIRRTGSYSRYPAQPVATSLPSKKELAQWVIEAEERAEAAESKVRELTPAASAWNELAEATGDYSVSDAAKVLSRDAAIDIGERRLFSFMAAEGWIFRSVTGRWRIYQTQVSTGRLAEKLGKPFWHEGRGEMVAAEPTVRITPKGLAELHRRLGGTGQLQIVAAS